MSTKSISVMNELDQVIETYAQASANLTYLKARTRETGINRLARNKSLYFIACGDAVKIGMSSNPESRLESLATGAPGPLILLAQIPCAGHRETECHHRLTHLHLHGEWYFYTHEVTLLIKEIQNIHD